MNTAAEIQSNEKTNGATRFFLSKVGTSFMMSRTQTLFLALTILLRTTVGSLIVSVAHETFRVSTSQALLILGLLSGIIIGSLSAFTRLRSYVVPTLLCALFLGTNGLFHILQNFFPFTEGGILLPYSTLLDWNLICYVFAFGFSTTWLFWRVRYFGTFEVLLGLLLSVRFFSLHRDFQFALAPKMVQRLAWELNTSSFSLLIMLAGVITIITISYLGATGHPGAPFVRITEKRPVFVQGGRRPVMELFGYGIILLCISLVSRGVYSYYLVVQESLGANGVGQRSAEESVGKSPLGFHSALGSNNQPAAVVRLSGDYPENPLSPMLYLREGALSAFNGRELVEAAEGFDDDVPGTSPSEFFRGQERMEYLERVPVPHSVYLLSDHKVVFTIDYPVSVEPLENPAPERFRGVYRAYSVAPAYPPSALLSKQTGNPEWSLEQKNFYLAQHSDSRYGELARTIVAAETNPASQASLLIEYLNKNAIYTLSPNHEVDPTADPVAPFLFGDMRGYCVHFAHATTYMLRALGIPARIATGYLTDLSQARDGHILLRMSDRHAWAEAYFEGAGWIPFDTQPEQVESHADSEVDAQLLEELMGLIGPESTLIPPEAYEGENAFEKPSSRWIPSILSLFMFIVGVYVLLLIRKFFIWNGWYLPGSTSRRIHRAHRAISIRLQDYGHPRAYAETHHEHLNRLSRCLGIFPTRIWQLSHKLRYADTLSSRDEIQGAIVADRKELSQLPRYKRFLSFFNPLNLLHG